MTPDWFRFVAWFEGTASLEEGEALDRWVHEHPKHAAIARTFRVMWEARGRAAVIRDEAARNLVGETERRVDAERILATVQASRPAVRRPRISGPYILDGRSAFRRWTTRSAIAALALLCLGLGAYIERRADMRAGHAAADSRSAMTAVATTRGQRASIQLPDGSRVTVGVASRVRYARDFGVTSRDVTLEGEAYFDVVHDGRVPFRVRTIHGITEDVGTRFAVRAYPGESSARVVVEEGKVAIGPRVILTAGDVARVTSDTAFSIRHDVRIDRLLSWTSGQLEFVGVPLRDVAADLGRWYDADIRVTDDGMANRTITASFRDASLDEVLDYITRVFGAHVERYGTARLLMTGSGATAAQTGHGNVH